MPDAIREIAKPGALHDEREIEAVLEVLRTSTLDLGPKIEEMERRTAELLAKRHGVMVNSGSSALRLAIDLLHLEPGDEIITSVLTFSTDIAPMVQSGIVPVLVDVEPASYQINVDRIEEMIGPRTKAILTPNLVGNCPDWDRIRAIADAHGLKVVEDSCDVLDSWLRGSRTGTRSDISVTSFARTHSITAAGNGGMVGIDDDDLLDECLMLRRWGRRSEQYLYGSKKGDDDRFSVTVDGMPYDNIFVFENIGYNFEPSEIGAAYGCVQLDKLQDYNERRRYAFRRYDDFFSGQEDRFVRPATTPDVDSTWMLYPYMVRDDAGFTRTEAQEFLESRGVPTRVVWSGNITRQPGFASIARREPVDGFPNADRVMASALMLPTHQALSSDDVGYVVEQLQALTERD
ncbi:MAG TPA: DegT/DnrJ/EryC1/StrS family aminotransferase [Acidimicrobiia bacterium]|nr:DegT/DnrJ/EryC1/StrS family aminotransferase [Acidimicrobiia bacterium]